MAKIVKLSVVCPQCGTKMPVPITENDLGTKKQGLCPNCHKKFLIPISVNLASKFESDPTEIGGGGANEISLLLETIANEHTAYQSFELTSDYYTIGRKNSSGPEYRPDIEVVTTDKMMSRIHAAITRKGRTGFTLKDIRSKNGIKVNNDNGKLDKEEEPYLNDGDTFCLGQTFFRVSITEHSMNSDELTK